MAKESLTSERAQSHGPLHDVPLFTISKSENRNQVQYAIRLDTRCRAVDAPLVAGWRMLEKRPSAREPLLAHELAAYGIARQVVVPEGEGDDVRFELRALPSRTITVHTWRTADGCGARAEVGIVGNDAQLFNVHAYLAWPLRSGPAGRLRMVARRSERRARDRAPVGRVWRSMQRPVSARVQRSSRGSSGR